MTDIGKTLEENRLGWLGHVIRREDKNDDS